jgi:hypothetical protein
VDERDRLVRVLCLVPCLSPPSKIAALVKVRPVLVVAASV